MKLSKHETVAQVIQALGYVEIAIEQATKFSVEARPHSRAPDVISAGYSASFSEHSDQSGQKIELDGCYIANEVSVAILEALMEKRIELKTWLKENGVDVDA